MQPSSATQWRDYAVTALAMIQKAKEKGIEANLDTFAPLLRFDSLNQNELKLINCYGDLSEVTQYLYKLGVLMEAPEVTARIATMAEEQNGVFQKVKKGAMHLTIAPKVNYAELHANCAHFDLSVPPTMVRNRSSVIMDGPTSIEDVYSAVDSKIPVEFTLENGINPWIKVESVSYSGHGYFLLKGKHTSAPFDKDVEISFNPTAQDGCLYRLTASPTLV